MEDIGKYKRILPFKIQTAYIPLEDENLIAADIITERGSIIPRPTFLRLGYRWNEKEESKRFNPLIQEGFNIVKIDTRGTGASTGTRKTPWSVNDSDINQIVNWIIQQPWADGKIVTFGSNFTANTSELSASLNNDAIHANIYCNNGYNLYSDVLFPGGLLLEWNLKTISDKTKEYENKIKLIHDPLYQPVLSEIKHQHQQNGNVYELFSSLQFSDDYIDADSKLTINKLSISNYSDEIGRNKAPKFCCGSWFTAKSASAVVHKFLNYSNHFIGVIGAWDNQLREVETFPKTYPPSLPSKLSLFLEYIRFSKRSLSNPTSIPKLLYYFTIGEQKWKVTDTWPLKNTENQLLYFNVKHQLTVEPPEIKGSKSEYRVNFNATSGTKNRWRTSFSTPVNYGNRSKSDKKLITFTSLPYKNSLEITGHPIVTLQLSSTHEDGAVFVYLEVIHRRRVYYLTEGQLRLIHYKESSSSAYKTPIPYHSFKKAETISLKSNLIYDLRIPLEPISVKLPENCKIRVAIAGADSGNFKHYPEVKHAPSWNIYHNSEYRSSIQLPIIKNEEDKGKE